MGEMLAFHPQPKGKILGEYPGDFLEIPEMPCPRRPVLQNEGQHQIDLKLKIKPPHDLDYQPEMKLLLKTKLNSHQ